MKLPNIILNIYRKELIEASCLANGWSRKKITALLIFCYKNGCDFKHPVRTYRGNNSIAKAMTYYKQRKIYLTI